MVSNSQEKNIVINGINLQDVKYLVAKNNSKNSKKESITIPTTFNPKFEEDRLIFTPIISRDKNIVNYFKKEWNFNENNLNLFYIPKHFIPNNKIFKVIYEGFKRTLMIFDMLARVVYFIKYEKIEFYILNEAYYPVDNFVVNGFYKKLSNKRYTHIDVTDLINNINRPSLDQSLIEKLNKEIEKKDMKIIENSTLFIREQIKKFGLETYIELASQLINNLFISKSLYKMYGTLYIMKHLISKKLWKINLKPILVDCEYGNKYVTFDIDIYKKYGKEVDELIPGTHIRVKKKIIEDKKKDNNNLLNNLLVIKEETKKEENIKKEKDIRLVAAKEQMKIRDQFKATPNELSTNIKVKEKVEEDPEEVFNVSIDDLLDEI